MQNSRDKLMEQSNKSGFNSILGVILAAAGSAIGLGNIWKFPYEAGQNGSFVRRSSSHSDGLYPSLSYSFF